MDPIKSICNGCVGERNGALLHSESESDDSIAAATGHVVGAVPAV